MMVMVLIMVMAEFMLVLLLMTVMIIIVLVILIVVVVKMERCKVGSDNGIDVGTCAGDGDGSDDDCSFVNGTIMVFC